MAETTLKKNAQGYGYKYTDLAQIHEYLENKNWTYFQYIDVKEGNDYIMTVKIDDKGNKSEPIRGCRVVQASLKGVNNPAQEQGSAITYARRYSLLLAYGLCTADDDAAIMSTPKEQNLSKAELLDKIDALADTKGIPMEVLCEMAKVSDLAELNKSRLEDCLEWLKQN